MAKKTLPLTTREALHYIGFKTDGKGVAIKGKTVDGSLSTTVSGASLVEGVDALADRLSAQRVIEVKIGRELLTSANASEGGIANGEKLANLLIGIKADRPQDDADDEDRS